MGFLSLFSRNKPSRSEEEQSRIETELSRMALYHFPSCPYCLRVRWALKRLGLDLELRDIYEKRDHFDQLVAGGGKKQVPCLRIEEPSGDVRWMYESGDIVRFLKGRFA